jgi:pimeloyl-ACP methyl ester carboxylesterase
MMASTKLANIPHYELISAVGSSRPCLVMVHGFSQHSGVFSAQVDWFRGRYPLLLIDLPGHGKSRGIEGPYGLQEYSEGVLAALDDAAVDAFHYWGTHTGAAVGLLLATQNPGRFQSLTLEGAVLPGVEMPTVAAAFARARAVALSKGIDAARRDWFAEAEFFDVIRRHPETCRSPEHWALISEFDGGPWSDVSLPRPVPSIVGRLAEVRSPTLLLNGEHDSSDFMDVADVLQRDLPVAERAIIAGAGGFPLWELPTAVNECVESFIMRHDRPIS